MALNVDEKVELRATFTRAGAAASPTTPVQFDVIKPDGTQESPIAATQESAGVYVATYTPDTHGTYKYRVRSADGGREIGKFDVRKEAFV